MDAFVISSMPLICYLPNNCSMISEDRLIPGAKRIDRLRVITDDSPFSLETIIDPRNISQFRSALPHFAFASSSSHFASQKGITLAEYLGFGRLDEQIALTGDAAPMAPSACHPGRCKIASGLFFRAIFPDRRRAGRPDLHAASGRDMPRRPGREVYQMTTEAITIFLAGLDRRGAERSRCPDRMAPRQADPGRLRITGPARMPPILR
jgi:hypothetical protein